jgi:release factor glutamine methyltransferase
VDERVLIPRPETELLVEAVLSRIEEVPSPQLADLGTGSGCIAISLAHARLDARVFATDASSGALQVAALNAQTLGVEERVSLIGGDVTHWSAPLLPAASGALHAIASNPPYIAGDEITQLQTEIVDYEPHSALNGGADGLDCYRALATQIKVLLAPQGFLALELGAGQFATVRALFEAQGWCVEAPLIDFGGIERVLVARPA